MLRRHIEVLEVELICKDKCCQIKKQSEISLLEIIFVSCYFFGGNFFYLFFNIYGYWTDMWGMKVLKRAKATVCHQSSSQTPIIEPYFTILFSFVVLYLPYILSNTMNLFPVFENIKPLVKKKSWSQITNVRK